MLISDVIANMIEGMLKESGGSLDIKRNELAQRMGCAPSQINYVITSRFTPEKGYIIESQRGGGGYVRIIKKEMSRNAYLMHCIYALGDEIDKRSAQAFFTNLADRCLIDPDVHRTLLATTSDAALSRVSPACRNSLRADIIRQFLLSLM